jgi:CBS-domain-containing membrane protein
MAKLKVRDLMTEQVLSIRADEDLDKLNSLMGDIHVRHVPVVDDEGEVIGIVSQRDLLRSALDTIGVLPQAEQKDLLTNTTVREIMVADPETVEASQDIDTAGQIMLDNKLGCLPVVDGTRLVGILTEADFVKFLVDRPEKV